MNKFCKTQTLPIPGTQFKTTLKNGDIEFISPATNAKRLANELVAFRHWVPGSGGDQWFVEYISGPHKGSLVAFSAYELKDVRPKYKTKQKKVSLKIFTYSILGKHKLKIKQHEYVQKLEISARTLSGFIQEITKETTGYSTYKYVEIESFQNLTQNELALITEQVNKSYLHMRKSINGY